MGQTGSEHPGEVRPAKSPFGTPERRLFGAIVFASKTRAEREKGQSDRRRGREICDVAEGADGDGGGGGSDGDNAFEAVAKGSRVCGGTRKLVERARVIGRKGSGGYD